MDEESGRRERARRRAASADQPTPLSRLAALRQLHQDPFEDRLQRVREASQRQQRAAARRAVALDAVAMTTGVLVTLVIVALGSSLPVALGIGLVVALLGLALRRRAPDLARARGASAWDWQVGRHRLLGDPSREVQRGDEPPTAPGPRR